MIKGGHCMMVHFAAMGPSVCILLASFLLLQGCEGVSLYEYYATDGVVEAGLVAEGDAFMLNNKQIVILSGAFHYFRVHPAYWRDTLRKLRAAGLNAVETYVPWNLHEPRQGVYDFGDLKESMSPFLDVRSFVQMAQEEDLFVILRPGPYICSEWDFGGMPSYLLRDYTMQVRTFYEGFRKATARFFDHLLPRLVDLQYTKGGSIIAVQIENEYGHFGYGDDPRDTRYLEFLRDNLIMNGFWESLFFTSDTPTQTQDLGAIPGVLMTANFKTEVEKNLALLKELQPDRPLMVMEFWTGWFDHWLSGIHAAWSPSSFASTLEHILQHNSSVNMYMFIGGTNFGFMAGANTLDIWPHYAPDVSSYDYDAPLTESGDYTDKYTFAKEIIARYNPLEGIVDHPDPPVEHVKLVYPSCPVTQALPLSTLLAQHESIESFEGPLSMELLPINNQSGQAYGYILYTTRAFLAATNSTLKIRGHVRDMAQVMVDGQVITKPYSNPLDVSDFGFWNGRDKELTLPGADAVAEVSILVENLGRVNYGKPHKFHQKKGLWEGPVLIDGMQIDQWLMYPLEFKADQVNNLTGWEPFNGSLDAPAMYRSNMHIFGTPRDTWLDMRGWGKGVVFVNGFNLGRYWHAGPTKTLYLPAPLLLDGNNEIVMFEQYTAGAEIVFRDLPIFS
ncbi:beta-galactosidase-1-like protein 2 [Panulirus ornatus]|uniref:beta-galactosidase-1-like protein 2 n=1 Tax=Panulirus ornatus TaxID=150431 RepID=UPI003A84FAF8